MVAETVGESESGGAFSSPAAGTCSDLQAHKPLFAFAQRQDDN